MAGRYANTLLSLGLYKGDRVAIQVDKSPDSLAIYAACVQSGLVFLPLNISYTPNEVKFFLEDRQARLFIGKNSNKNELFDISKKLGVIFETLDSAGSGSFADKSRKMPDSFITRDCNFEDLVAWMVKDASCNR